MSIGSMICSQESPRKQVGVGADPPGRLPEVKAIQQTRRLLANARERTRVHTISAAFEALRKQVRLKTHKPKRIRDVMMCIQIKISFTIMVL